MWLLTIAVRSEKGIGGAQCRVAGKKKEVSERGKKMRIV
jgi:hypothetical protein